MKTAASRFVGFGFVDYMNIILSGICSGNNLKISVGSGRVMSILAIFPQYTRCCQKLISSNTFCILYLDV